MEGKEGGTSRTTWDAVQEIDIYLLKAVEVMAGAFEELEVGTLLLES